MIHKPCTTTTNSDEINLEKEAFNLAASRIYKRVQFDSRSELACARLLELCVKDWTPIEGKTVHIPIGFKRSVDFRVGQYLIEFHPIRIFREFHSAEATKQLTAALSKVGTDERQQIVAAITKELGIQYTKKRQFVMNFSNDVEVRDSTLLVAFNSFEFCDKILPKVATEKLPNRNILISQFYKWRR